MKKYSSKYLPLIVGTACAAGVILGSFLNFSNSEEVYIADSNKQKLTNLIDYINYDYVDRVNTDSIVDITVKDILSKLDPHSVYISRANYQQVAENLDGDFVGIGIQYFQVGDTMAVLRTLSGGPGEKEGILPGDRIIYANHQKLTGKNYSLDTLKLLLQGRSGTAVPLRIKRTGNDSLLDFNIVRDRIPIKSVVASFKVEEHLGYVKIDRFTKNTYTEFKTAVTRLEKEGVKDLILDLRDNGGGYLKEAIRVADEFLAEGKLILTTKNKNGKIKNTYATKEGDFEDAKVYVVINENSASASEVVAGALQDNDVGTILGQRSYGKGLVQREMNLGDGSAIRLTVARYYTPTGRSIQKSYKDKTNSDYYRDYINRHHNGELTVKDSIHINDSLKFTTPKGKIVYGGGGIIPDIFIPKDINYRKESLDYMLNSGVMDRFIFNELDKNRKYYNALSRQMFESEVEISNEMVEDFQSFLGQFNLNFKSREYTDLLKIYLKATMAHQLFDTALYQHILIANDELIQKVIRIAGADLE